MTIFQVDDKLALDLDRIEMIARVAIADPRPATHRTEVFFVGRVGGLSLDLTDEQHHALVTMYGTRRRPGGAL